MSNPRVEKLQQKHTEHVPTGTAVEANIIFIMLFIFIIHHKEFNRFEMY